MKTSNIGDMIHREGILKQAVKQNRPSKQKQKTYKNVDVCLNCTKTKCNGNCKLYKESIKNEKKI